MKKFILAGFLLMAVFMSCGDSKEQAEAIAPIATNPNVDKFAINNSYISINGMVSKDVKFVLVGERAVSSSASASATTPIMASAGTTPKPTPVPTPEITPAPGAYAQYITWETFLWSSYSGNSYNHKKYDTKTEVLSSTQISNVRGLGQTICYITDVPSAGPMYYAIGYEMRSDGNWFNIGVIATLHFSDGATLSRVYKTSIRATDELYTFLRGSVLGKYVADSASIMDDQLIIDFTVNASVLKPSPTPSPTGL